MNLNTKIFLDSSDPNETREAIKCLGFLDGQTTNPSLVAKNPLVRARFEKGEKFSTQEILQLYKQVIVEISNLIPNGSVSIEVYSDENTSISDMLDQAKEMWTWVPNSHIKFPTTKAGLEAAAQFAKEGGRCNMTLIFDQEQAAAVFGATVGKNAGDIFVSPFIGRLDDIGLDGMDLVKNCRKMFAQTDHHVQVLAASTRSLDHFLACLQNDADIITAPLSLLKQWADSGMQIPDKNWQYNSKHLQPIKYKDLNLDSSWSSFDLDHELTAKGLKKFAQDWNSLIISN